jgi:hypothetical protein
MASFRLKLSVVLGLALAAFTGCESTHGGVSSQVGGSFYYGVGFYDPWYYGDYHDHGDIIVTPPPDGGRESEFQLYKPFSGV